MLRKWLLSSAMVTGSRCCQEMLIEGQILDNSIHHCFHNCLRPPSWTAFLWLKRRDVLQLLFLAKAASHKLYCNYRPADDFYHLFGHMWSFARRVFQLCVKKKKKKKRSNPYTFFFLFIAHSFSSYASFCVAQVFVPFLLLFFFLSTTSQSHDRCWADIKPAAFFFFCLQVLTPRFTTHFPGRVWLWRSCCLRKCLCALGIISALPAVAPDTPEPLSRPLILEQLILTTHDV